MAFYSHLLPCSTNLWMQIWVYSSWIETFMIMILQWDDNNITGDRQTDRSIFLPSLSLTMKEFLIRRRAFARREPQRTTKINQSMEFPVGKWIRRYFSLILSSIFYDSISRDCSLCGYSIDDHNRFDKSLHKKKRRGEEILTVGTRCRQSSIRTDREKIIRMIKHKVIVSTSRRKCTREL